MTPLDGPEPYEWAVVYFARVRGLPEIKIGCTSQLRVRLYETRRKGINQAAYPLVIVKGGQQLEARFHAMFEPYHIGHEWFEPHPVILEAIIALHAGEFDWSRLPARGWCITKPFQTVASLSHWGPLPRFEQAKAA